jgi:hypothetical protein
MRRRGLLHHSPSLLGYTGTRWQDPEPMDDLVADCYVFAILERLRALRSQLKLRDNIDGFVRLNIRHFLGDRQRRANPVRYALFKNLEASLSDAVRLSAWKVDHVEDGRIHADCVFYTSDGLPSEPASAEQLRGVVTGSREWVDLVDRLGARSVAVQKRTRAALREMIAAGVVSFRLRDLVDVLAEEIKSRAAGQALTLDTDCVWESSDDGVWRQIRIFPPDARYEERERFESLIKCMREGIDRLDRRAAVRRRIRRVFDFLIERIESGEEVSQLTYAEIGRKLAIARATLGEDIDTLRKLAGQLSSGG